MSTIKKEYLCQVTVIEARELSRSDMATACDPFVRVTCGDLEPQATTCETSTTNPCWAQSFTFSDLQLTDYELETWELKFEAFDFSAFTRNELIGTFSVGLSTLHRNSNHEFYNVWLTLLHPDLGSEPRGYLLINAFIVGPDDAPPAHAIGEKVLYEEEEYEDEDWMDDVLPPSEIQKRKQQPSKISCIGAPSFARKSYQLSINIYKAENIPPIFSSINPFVSARAVGLVEKTPYVQNNRNPIWNTKISFAVSEPILNDKIVLRMWSKVLRGRDSLIATIPEIPNNHDPFNITRLQSRGGVMPCRWFNMYGHPPGEYSLFQQIKQWTGFARRSYMGNIYMGRILISISLNPNEMPEAGVTQANPYREPVNKMHMLKVVVYELKNAKGCGDRVRIRVSIGPHESYSTFSNRKRANEKNKPGYDYFIWGNRFSGESIKEIREPFPVDTTQVPDVMVDLCTNTLLGGEKRIGYFRKSVSDILPSDKPKWFPFKSVDTHSEIGDFSPGNLLIGIYYGPEESLHMQNKTRPRKKEMYFHARIFGGYDVAPSLSDQDTKTLFRIFIGDHIEESVEKSGKYPRWDDHNITDIPVQLHDDLSYEPNLRFQLMQRGSYLGIKNWEAEIGSFTVPLSKIEDTWAQPHFFHLVNPAEEGVSQGRILAEFHISRQPSKSLDYKPCSRDFKTHLCNIKLAVIGIRDLHPPYKHPELHLEIPGYEMMTDDGTFGPARLVITPSRISDTTNPNFLKIVTFHKVKLPAEPIFLPAVSIKVVDNFYWGNECFTYIPLIKYANWVQDESMKRDALELYHRNFSIREQIEQAPVISNPEEEYEMIKTFTNYSTQPTEENLIEDIKFSHRVASPDLDDIINPANYHISHKIIFDKKLEDQAYEDYLREEMKQKLQAEIQAKDDEIDALRIRGRLVSRRLEAQLRKFKRQLRQIEEGPVTEQKFWKREDELLDEDEFNYGRSILKNGTYETLLQLPYERFLLFKKTKNSQKLSVYRVGDPTGAVIKLAVKIEIIHETLLGDEFVIPDKENQLDFDFFHPIFEGRNDLLEVFNKQKYSVRLYLLRGLSLCAVQNAPDIVGMAGGLAAKSSADSYPEVMVGYNKDQQGRYVNDQLNPEKQTLNPHYFKFYSLSAAFPSDWRLLINIWDGSGWGFNNLIGSTQIDLEDRYFGDPYNTEKLMISAVENVCKLALKTVVQPEARKRYEIMKREAKKRQIYLHQDSKQIPVEYRPIIHPKKHTAQGNLEMWVEVYEINEAKMIPIARITKPQPETYEMRAIIWRCEGLPTGTKSALDIYFTCQFDPTGWLEEAISKSTDTHLGSEDGSAIFNWRMKFEFDMPCSFARMRIVANEFSTFSQDTILAEEVLDLTKYFKRLRKEGKLYIEEEWVSLHIPNFPQKPAGRVLTSFYLLTKAEADSRPVGEGQDEPNHDPELEKPEQGRGVTNYIVGTVVDVKGWTKWLGLNNWKSILAIVVICILFFVLFIYPGSAVK
jgi:hypothetical protein